MIRGSNQALPVTSTPSDAVVQTSGQKKQTPAVVTVSRKKFNHKIHISKQGYISRTVIVNRVSKPISFLNILLLPIAPFGVIMDSSTGADHVFKPNKIHVNLIKLDSQQAQNMINPIIHGLKVAPEIMHPGSEFSFEIIYAIRDGTTQKGQVDFNLKYGIVRNDNILFEDEVHLTAPRGIKYSSKKTGLIAGRHPGTYQLVVQINYKGKSHQMAVPFRIK